MFLLKNRIFQGFLVFLALSSIYFIALTLAHPSENIGLDILCRWDCGWYKAIIRNGYISTIPPVPQLEDQANVAFFPLYPLLGGALSAVAGIKSDVSLPLTSILFALGFFLVLSRLTDWKRILLIAAYPATFYMWVGYGESVYCFFLVLGLLSFQMKSRYAPLLALLSGLSLGLARLTGFVIAGAVAGVRTLEWILLRRTRADVPLRPVLWMLGSILGAGSFFLFCHLRFGVWNIYFQTLDIGWHKEFSISGFFSIFFSAIRNYFTLLLSAQNPVSMSWLITLDLILVYIYVLVLEVRASWRERDEKRLSRLALLIGGFAHLLITTIGDSGDWHRWMNGMRYSMPAFFLLVILWDSAWVPQWIESRPILRRGLYFVLLGFWLPFQIYYLYLFTRQAWVS